MISYNKLIHLHVLIGNLYLFRFPVGVKELILVQKYPLVLQNLYLYKGTRRYIQNITMYITFFLFAFHNPIIYLLDYLDQ